jgi:ferrous iron transport protein A
MKTLVDLSPGQSAVVGQVSGAPELRRRLLELGLVPGTRLHLVRRAPLGDPLEITVRGYALSLRRDEASLVEVGS